jgi:primary-amine oxidase
MKSVIRPTLLLAAMLFASRCITIKCCPKQTAQSANPHMVSQTFPSGGPAQTEWLVYWGESPAKGLYITGAWFRKVPGPWTRILYDARLSDIFVPYHPGSPRYYDLSQFTFNLVQVTPADAGCCGKLLGTPPKVVKEVRDRGVMWKDDQAVRRGEELILWSTLDAANYNYIIQYGFRDDGTITFRLGATARNLPGAVSVAHMHNGLWRLDIDLGGAPNDTAHLMVHSESGLAATDSLPLFNGGVEGSADWNDLEFTEVSVMDTVIKNGLNHNIMWDLMPMRSGSARHFEPFAHHDFWVTQYNGLETAYPALPSYINAQPISNNDIVVWTMSSMHHLPRDEDGEIVSGVFVGSALLMWSGFDLRPRNYFERTPLFP